MEVEIFPVMEENAWSFQVFFLLIWISKYLGDYINNADELNFTYSDGFKYHL